MQYRHHCHCAARGGSGRLVCMKGSPEEKNWLSRAASAVAGTVREMNDAQQRVLRQRVAYDSSLPSPRKAPSTYPEFLLRTSAPSRHEPTAAQRAAGRGVR
jgi:hypothetical protein